MRATLKVMSVVAITLVSFTWSVGGSTCCDGDKWLGWSQTERQVYMEGYVRALMHGYGQGCNSVFVALADRHGKNADVIHTECLAKTPVAGINFTPFAERITQFYMDHPDQRGKLLTSLIDEMIAKERKKTHDISETTCTSQSPAPCPFLR